MRYLVDTSALVRLQREQVDPGWKDLVGRGLLVLCEPVLVETLMIADAKEYASTEDDLRESYVVATVPDGIWDLAPRVSGRGPASRPDVGPPHRSSWWRRGRYGRPFPVEV